MTIQLTDAEYDDLLRYEDAILRIANTFGLVENAGDPVTYYREYARDIAWDVPRAYRRQQRRTRQPRTLKDEIVVVESKHP